MTREEQIKAMIWEYVMAKPIAEMIRDVFITTALDDEFPRLVIPDLKKQSGRSSACGSAAASKADGTREGMEFDSSVFR